MTDLPQGWREVALKDAAEVVMGQSPPSSAYNEVGAGKPFFQGKAEFGDKHPTVKKWTTEGSKHAIAGDILMSVRAPVGPTNIANVDCVIGRGLAAIRAGSLTNQTYLLWVLRSIETDIAARGVGTTFASISGGELRSTRLPLPPLATQERIVEILEEQFSRLDSALASVKAVREKAKAFRRSLLHSAFSGELTGGTEGWREVALGEVCIRASKVKPEGFERATFTYVDIGSINSQRNVIEGPQLLAIAEAPSRARQLLEGGDTVFSTVRPYLRNIAWVGNNLAGEVASTGFTVLRAKSGELSSRLLFFFATSDELLDQVLPLQQGTSYPAVRDNDLFDAKIALPPLAEQERIVEILEEQFSRLDKALEVANQLEARIASERRSLLHSAFTGALTSTWRQNND